MEQIFKSSKKEFERVLRNILTRAGFSGTFAVIIRRTDKSQGGHDTGLRIGNPKDRTVELKWRHHGGVENCIVMELSVPHDSDTTDFHKKIDRAHVQIGDEEDEALRAKRRSKQKLDADVINHPAVGIAEASRDALDSAILKILQISPDFGFFNREEDLEKLAEFGDPEQLLRSLVAAKDLLPHSDNLLQLAPHWLVKAEDAPAEMDTSPQPWPVVASPAPTSPPAPAISGDLLQQLKRAKDVASRAEAARITLHDSHKEVFNLEAQIKANTQRLETLRAARTKAETFLKDPDTVHALELLALVGEIAKK